MESTLAKLEKCVRYHDFESACYLAAWLSEISSDYVLLSGIMQYFSGEYTRAISLLKRKNSTTAIFYCALAHRKMKNYQAAIRRMEMILGGSTVDEPDCESWYSAYFVSSADTEFYYTFLGELYTLAGKTQLAIRCMSTAVCRSPLLAAVEYLYSEDTKVSSLSECPISAYYSALCNITVSSWEISGRGELRETLETLKSLRKTRRASPYLLSKLATACARFGAEKEALRIFRVLRKKYPFWIREMDEYSTLLWKIRDSNSLGLLAKDLISSHPDHYVTWIVIGNYYSLRRRVAEATQAFMRSLAVHENPHAYALLGFEYNSKSRFADAQNYFRSSLCMLENNDRAMFGLGISYAEMLKKELAEAYFLKAMSINPYSLHMKAYLVRFYVKTREYDKALQKIREYLGLKGETHPEILEEIETHAGNYTELEELIICELAEILIRNNSRKLAAKTLESVSCRTSSYFSKRALLEGGEVE